jgi:alpha-galactosidase
MFEATTYRRCLVARMTTVGLALLLASKASALDDGLARTPPMGWNSWNRFQLNINEALIRSVVDAIVANGMKAAGYQYVIIDAGWKGEVRDASGRLTVDAKKFPSGIKALADYVHGRGLKVGVYTDAGAWDCVAGTPGSKGHEAIDAATFAEWGIDFVKEDWCNTEGMNAREAYTKMHKAIAATRRPMVFSICEWGDSKPWEWGAEIAHMWRTTGDNKDCWDCGRETAARPGGFPRGWTLILDAQPRLQKYAGPGHWNDADMLEVGMPGLTVDESRAHFSLWCILASPLIAGCDVRTMGPQIAEIHLNREVIAVDQDPLGIQGTRVSKVGDAEVWAKRLQDGSQAVVLFNRSKRAMEIEASFEALKLPVSGEYQVRNLWLKKDVGRFRDKYRTRVPSHGVEMLRVTPPA